MDIYGDTLATGSQYSYNAPWKSGEVRLWDVEQARQKCRVQFAF
jgi:hypothetical protein